MVDSLAPAYSNTPVSDQRPRFGYTPDEAPVQPAVSIITPCYDTGTVFLETAQSVLQQSLQQWEWIIINDGSHDPETLCILERLRTDDPRVRVWDMPANVGPARARNAGIDMAEADLLFFLDADDLIEPTALEKLAWCLESYPELGMCKGYTTWFGAEQVRSTHGFEAGQRFLHWNLVTILAMVRREIAVAAGGFDETLVHGLEDWEFWLRCASQGHWGRTIPEYLDWYRRRQDHEERWAAWSSKGEGKMRRELRHRYPKLYADGFPQFSPQPPRSYADIRDDVPFANILTKQGKRILLVLPWMAMGGADKFNLDLMAQLASRGYEISIATTLAINYQWHRQFAAITPDIFVLPHFLQVNDYARFLYYLILSRQTDVVLVSNSEIGYRLLPFLRSHCPDTAFVDYCHMEEEYWNNGGHPRQAVAYQDVLDVNVVSSRHLKGWMTNRGADPAQIEVCYTNVDSDLLSPDPDLGLEVRSKLGIAQGIPLILYAGRLCEQKQPKVFARVMLELRRRQLAFVSVVAGDGEDRRWLVSFLRRHRLGRQVKMLGAVSNERVRDLLAASDILFLPSQMEGISLTIFEAMAMGVVTVSADVGGQKELLTPDCGVLVLPAEEQEMVTAYADALERLMECEELRRSMAQASKDRVRTDFPIDEMGRRMDTLLDQALQFRRTRPKPGLGKRLAAEHAVQAIEYHRLSKAAGGLWKYRRAEAARWRLSSLYASWRQPLNRLAWHLGRRAEPVRKVKDAVWVAGHGLRLRVSGRGETE